MAFDRGVVGDASSAQPGTVGADRPGPGARVAVLPAGWTVESVTSPAELDREEWDRLVDEAEGGFYLTHAWLSAIHGVDGFAERLALARDPSGRLAAAVGLYTIEHITNPLYNLQHVLAPDAEAADWEPQLVIGARSGYTNGILATSAEGDEAVAALAREAIRETSCGSAGMMYLERPHAARMVPLLGDVVPVLTGFRVRIPVTFDSFEGYRRTLSKERRWEVARELRRFSDAGCRMERTSLEPYVDQLAPLLGNVQRHHGVDIPDELHAGYLRGCARGELGERAVVFQCHRGDRLIGFALGFRGERQLTMRVAGLDYEHTVGTNAYFAMMCYEPVKYALEHSLEMIDLGPEGYRAKLLRGGKLVPLWSLPIHTPDTWGAKPAEAHNGRMLRKWQDTLGDVVDLRAVLEAP
jgi:predicted N-acyltransferase